MKRLLPSPSLRSDETLVTVEHCRSEENRQTTREKTKHSPGEAYLPKVRRVAQHVHVEQLGHVSTAVGVVLLSEGRADGSTLLLDHLALLGLGPGRPDGPDQLPQSDRSWHPLESGGRTFVSSGGFEGGN